MTSLSKPSATASVSAVSDGTRTLADWSTASSEAVEKESRMFSGSTSTIPLISSARSESRTSDSPIDFISVFGEKQTDFLGEASSCLVS
jgi:hypothetical protein